MRGIKVSVANSVVGVDEDVPLMERGCRINHYFFEGTERGKTLRIERLVRNCCSMAQTDVVAVSMAGGLVAIGTLNTHTSNPFHAPYHACSILAWGELT
jgi:hypothetical protein